MSDTASSDRATAGSVISATQAAGSSDADTYPAEGKTGSSTQNTTMNPIATTNGGRVEIRVQKPVTARSTHRPWWVAARIPSAVPATSPMTSATPATDNDTSSRWPICSDTLTP